MTLIIIDDILYQKKFWILNVPWYFKCSTHQIKLVGLQQY
jgi:hypothetical protein